MKTPIIIRSDIICKALSVFISVGAITLFPFIIVRKDYDNEVTLTHESIHIKQQQEGFIFGFYALYIFYWIRGIAKGLSSSDAYFEIPYEKEAYANQYNPEYLLTRKKNAWKDYRV